MTARWTATSSAACTRRSRDRSTSPGACSRPPPSPRASACREDSRWTCSGSRPEKNPPTAPSPPPSHPRPPAPPTDPQAPPCTDPAEAEAEPLEEVLMGMAGEALTAGDWPPPSVASGTPGTFSVEGHEVPTIGVQRTVNEEGIQRVYSETVAADPWSPQLSGLAREARFQTLSPGTERVSPGGKRESEESTRLVRWGSWLEGAK